MLSKSTRSPAVLHFESAKTTPLHLNQYPYPYLNRYLYPYLPKHLAGLLYIRVLAMQHGKKTGLERRRM